MGSSAARRQRKQDAKGGVRPLLPLTGPGLAQLPSQLGGFIKAAEELQEAAKQFEGVQELVQKVDATRGEAERILAGFRSFEAELELQRAVNLRLLAVQASNPSSLLNGNPAHSLQSLEAQYRAEYAALQGLVTILSFLHR